MSRAFSLVIGRDSHALSCPVAGANGLHDRLAIVLSTWRPDADNMIMDDALWAACMQAATRSFKADETQVICKIHRGLLDRLRGKPEMINLGSLSHFIAQQLAEPDQHDWTEVRWFSGERLVAVARCENWSSVGGPDLYHDSYTSRIWLKADMIDDLVAALRVGAIDEGAILKDIIRLPRNQD